MWLTRGELKLVADTAGFIRALSFRHMTLHCSHIHAVANMNTWVPYGTLNATKSLLVSEDMRTAHMDTRNAQNALGAREWTTMIEHCEYSFDVLAYIIH